MSIVLGMISIITIRADEAMPPITRSQPADSGVGLDGKLGVGVMVGEPSGGNLKFWLTDTLALDGAIGWSFRDDTDLYLHSDILWHYFNVSSASQGRLAFYTGAGGLVRFRDNHRDDEFGIRMPLGVSYTFEKSPMDVFVEFAPAIDLSPNVRADFTGGIGIRYWF